MSASQNNQRYICFDFETRATVDLKAVGAWEYSANFETEILCLAWCTSTKDNKNPEVMIWSPALPKTKPNLKLFLKDFFDLSVIKIAHNAGFEKSICRNVLPKYIGRGIGIQHEEWICTATMAAALALPRNLEGACEALGLSHKKDMTGHRLMMKLSKPRKPSKNNPAKWHCLKKDLLRLIDYCVADVKAEWELFLTIPELSKDERKVWLLDQKMNFRGFNTDQKLINIALKLIAKETKVLNQETKAIVQNEFSSTTQRDKVLKWLEGQAIFLPDLRAKTVQDAITEGVVKGPAKRLLEIRQAIGKTSTKKYIAFKERSGTDGRIRDFLMYHGASTGRWTGKGTQVQNLPRGVPGLDTNLASDFILKDDLELLRLLYGEPMNVFSSCVRSIILPSPGTKLFGGDYAAIEARVLFWVAGHTKGLKSFSENKPMYEEMAQVIYNVEDIKDVTKEQRMVGKQAFLGCGYNMGWKKFLQTCLNFGIQVDEVTAQKAVKAYRNFHYPVVKLWEKIELAAKKAVHNPVNIYAAGCTQWQVKDGFLWCTLPSGRKLAYYKPSIKYEDSFNEEKRAVLYHWGVNPKTKIWEESGTYGGRLVENVVQAISRDLMVSAMLRLEYNNYALLLTVHDEILAEKKYGNVKEFEQLMVRVPLWAMGLPMKVEGWSGDRYQK